MLFKRSKLLVDKRELAQKDGLEEDELEYFVDDYAPSVDFVPEKGEPYL